MKQKQSQDFLHRKRMKSDILRETKGIIDRTIYKVSLGTVFRSIDKQTYRILHGTVKVWENGAWRELLQAEVSPVLADGRFQLHREKLRLGKAIRKAKWERMDGDKVPRASKFDGKWNRDRIARLGKIVLALEVLNVIHSD